MRASVVKATEQPEEAAMNPASATQPKSAQANAPGHSTRPRLLRRATFVTIATAAALSLTATANAAPTPNVPKPYAPCGSVASHSKAHGPRVRVRVADACPMYVVRAAGGRVQPVLCHESKRVCIVVAPRFVPAQKNPIERLPVRLHPIVSPAPSPVTLILMSA